jgi:osmoprotectant transport system substrate-binding protein
VNWDDSRIERRQALKRIGAVGAGVAFAGCSGIVGETGESRDATGGENTITVGSKTYTEQINLGYLAYHLLDKNTGVSPIDNMSYGGNPAFRELYEGNDPSIDIYYEYMGSAWSTEPLARDEQISDRDELYAALQEELESYPVEITEPTDWENTWTPFGRESTLKEYGFETLSDLAAYVNGGNYDITFAVEQSYFGRADGFGALTDHYGFDPDHLQAWKDAGGVFRLGSAPVTGTAIDQGKAEIGLGYSTSAWITDIDGELQTLEDDEGFWPAFHVVGVVHEEVANETVLKQVEKLPEVVPDEEMMRQLNSRATETSPRTATREHLESNDYI